MWLTNKETGGVFNTDWADKDRQIAENKKQADEKSLEEKYQHINPNYTENAKHFDPYSNNCVKCALAFEANMRGDDVEALGRNYKDSNENELVRTDKSIAKAIGKQNDIWEVGASNRELVIKRIKEQMEDFGSDSRAILSLNHKTGHHVVNVLANNGNPIIVDAQSGKHGDVATMLKYYNTKNANIIRIDDVKIPDSLKEWAYKRR
jgi:hypothetical protein